MTNLAFAQEKNQEFDAAVPLFEQLLNLKIKAYGHHHPLTYRSSEHLARCSYHAKRYPVAIGQLKILIPWWKIHHAQDDPVILNGLDQLSESYLATHQLALAIPVLEELVAIRIAKLGAGHPDTLSALHKLAHGQYDLRNYSAAAPHFEKLAAEYKIAKGENDPDFLSAVDYLSVCYNQTGRILDAMPLYGKVLADRRTRLGNTHADTMNVMLKIVNGHHALGNVTELVPAAEELVRIYTSVKGNNHVETIQMMNKLGEAYRISRQDSAAVAYLETTLNLATRSLGPNHPTRLDCLNGLAAAYFSADRHDKAVAMFLEAFELLAKSSGEDHYLTHVALLNYSTGLARNGQNDLARRSYERLLAMYRRRTQPGTTEFAGLLAQTGYLLLNQREYKLAEAFCRESLAIRERLQPAAWTTTSTRTMIGAAMLGQKKYAECERLLVTGHADLLQNKDQIPIQGWNRIYEAGQNLADLYELTGRRELSLAVRSQMGREIAPPPSSTTKGKP